MRTEARGISLAESSAVDSSQVSGSLIFPSRQQSTQMAQTPQLAQTPQAFLRFAVFAVLAASGVAWDLWSKWAVFDRLNCPGQLAVWKGSLMGVTVEFDLATTFNHGALWGIGQNQTWFFATLSFIAVVVIGYFVWTRQAIASWWLTIATGLLLAGTLGNLYDRLGLHGWKDVRGPVYAVRDFLDFIFSDGAFHWATFNFADTYLVTGAIMLVLQSFWTPNDVNGSVTSGQKV